MTNRGYGTALSEKLNLGFKNWVQIIPLFFGDKQI